MKISAKGPAFSNLVLERELKIRGKSTVLLVRREDTNTRYIYREFSGSPEVYKRLQHTDCPYLPNVYAVEKQEGRVCVLEEFIQGDSLDFILEGGPLPEAQAVQILGQVCKGLEVLHRLGAVHRDVKPDNIVLRGSDAVLIDFDASRLIKPENTTDTQIMGTTGYAAPEQYGFSQTDARADIYALGVLLNEMLTGQHPSKYLARPPYREIIEKCIEVNVDKRYPDTVQLRAALNDGKKGKKKLLPTLVRVAAIALLGCGLLFGSRSAEAKNTEGMQTEPLASQKTEAATESTSSLVILESKELVMPDTCWTGSDRLYRTTFTYDLDGDGTSETYEFGSYQHNIPEGVRHSLSDTFYLAETDCSERTVYPSVWRTDGEQYVLEDGFAPMLENARVTLWPAKEGQKNPQVFTAESEWSGGIRAMFEYENQGLWYYEVTAELEGQTLTAFSRSIVRDMADYTG